MSSASVKCQTGADLVRFLASCPLQDARRRDLISSVNRIAALIGCALADMRLEPRLLRRALDKVRPARHGVSSKSFANIRCAFAAALAMAGVADRIPRGLAKRHTEWGPLVSAIASDKKLACGLALFVNWCVIRRVAPAHVCDTTVEEFRDWLETCIYPRPQYLVRRLPQLWSAAALAVPSWPVTRLSTIWFKAQSPNLGWDRLDPTFTADANAYLDRRARPDIFDDSERAPLRPLAASTLRQQREHIRLAASVVTRSGICPGGVASLEDLVSPEAVKCVLRHYLRKADGKPNAFAESLAKTLLSIARHHASATGEEIARLKALVRRLPSMPFDLTGKNKALLAEFESERRLAALFRAPDQLIAESATALAASAMPLVKSQCAIAIDVLLVAPLRPQNLAHLNWRRHIREPDGPRGPMQLVIPGSETKSRKRDLIFEVPADVASRLRWYKRQILTALNADPCGDLFVTHTGRPKAQETLSQQLTETLGDRIGVHMTPHQFRHLAAKLYLDAHPEDFETIRALLGHSFAKTTLIYAGAASQRASRAFGALVIEKRQQLVTTGRRRAKSIGGPARCPRANA